MSDSVNKLWWWHSIVWPTSTTDSSVLWVVAVVWTNGWWNTEQEALFSTSAVYIIQVDWSWTSTIKCSGLCNCTWKQESKVFKICWVKCMLARSEQTSCRVAKLLAYHSCLIRIPVVITDCSPGVVQADLNSSFISSCATNQPRFSIIAHITNHSCCQKKSQEILWVWMSSTSTCFTPCELTLTADSSIIAVVAVVNT